MDTTRGAVLITGASTGIGAETAVYLDSHNFHVFAGVRKLADAQPLTERASSRLTPVRLDITDPDQIADAVQTVREQIGDTKFIGLVNNAGITVNQPIEFIPLEELRRQLEVNFIGQVAVTQAYLPLLRASRGRIVMMSSISGRIATPMFGAYAASKFALEAASDVLRVELRPWGIRVAIIEPGAIATPIWQKGVESGEQTLTQFPEQARHYYERPLKRMLRYTSRHAEKNNVHPRVVAQAVEHALIASRPRARYLIGRDAYQLLALSYMPTWLRDFILGKTFGLR